MLVLKKLSIITQIMFIDNQELFWYLVFIRVTKVNFTIDYMDATVYGSVTMPYVSYNTHNSTYNI